MPLKRMMIDPCEGWRYGFPRPVPPHLIGNMKAIEEWMVKDCGYPRDLLKYPSRHWEESVK